MGKNKGEEGGLGLIFGKGSTAREDGLGTRLTKAHNANNYIDKWNSIGRGEPEPRPLPGPPIDQVLI